MNIQVKFEQLLALVGQGVEVEDPTALDQCMDFAFKWCLILGIDVATIRHAYAYQVWKQPTDLTVKFFSFIPNTPNGVPPLGALVIFDENVPGVTSIAGHICVAKGEGDSNTFKSLDQNWNSKPYVTEETHSYVGVLGWLIPYSASPQNGILVDQVTFDKLVTESSKYEAFVKGGYSDISEVTTKLQQLSDQISTLQSEHGAMALATQQDKDTIAKQADLLKQQAQSDSTAIDAGITGQQKAKELASEKLAYGLQLGIQNATFEQIMQGIQALQNTIKANGIVMTAQTQNFQNYLKDFINRFIRFK